MQKKLNQGLNRPLFYCRCILLSSLVISCFFSTAQNTSQEDSLMNLLAKSKPDSNAVQYLILLGQLAEAETPALAKSYYLRADTLSKKIGWKKGRIRFIANYTYLLNSEGRFDSSVTLNLEALQLARSTGDSILTGKCLINTANAYRVSGDLETSVGYFLQGRSIFEKSTDTALLAQLHDILQVMYSDLHQYAPAIKSGELAISASRAIKNPVFLTAALVNLSNTLQLTGKRANAADLLHEALRITGQTGDINTRATILNNLANIYLQTDYQKAKPYLDQALPLFIQVDSKEGEAIVLRNLAFYFFRSKQFDRSKTYAEQALTIATQNQLKVEMSKVLQMLADISAAEHDVVAYQNYRQRSENISDSIFDENLQNRIVNLEKKYETEKKQLRIRTLEDEQQIQQLSIKKSRQVNLLLAGISMALAVISFLLWRNYRQKQKMHVQSLSSLKAEQELQNKLALEKERTRIATDMHDDMGTGLSRIRFLGQSMLLKIQQQQAVDDEIGKINSYAHELIGSMGEIVWALNEKNDVLSDLVAYTRVYAVEYLDQHLISCIFIAPDEVADTFVSGDVRRNIYLVIKEALHNIVKHSGARNVRIDISTGSRLGVSISDDGCGMSGSGTRRTGNGLNNMRDRIRVIGGKLEVKTNNGTVIEFSVPLV